MIYKILVVDDEIESRQSFYNRLFVMSQELFGMKFHVDYVRDPRNIADYLKTMRYDAILADVVLEPKWNFNLETLYLLIQSSISRSSPILLVSKTWNDANDDTLNKALISQNWKAFLYWDSFESSNPKDKEFNANQLRGVLKQQENINPMQKVLSDIDNEIRIVHFSDIHAGSGEFSDPFIVVEHSANAILERWNAPPHFVCVSGDITDSGTPDQFKLASDLFESFLNILEKPIVLFVPGNHDYCLPLALSAQSCWNKKQSKFIKSNRIVLPSLVDFSLRPYSDFRSLFNLRYEFDFFHNNGSWLIDFFVDAGILLYGINTNALSFPFSPPTGLLPEGAFKDIFTKLSRLQRRHKDIVTLGMFHHSPLDFVDIECVKNPEFFEKMFSGGGNIKTNLILCGHIHKQKSDVQHMVKYNCNLLTSSSLTKEESGVFRGFNLLKINIKEKMASVLSVEIQGDTMNRFKETEIPL